MHREEGLDFSHVVAFDLDEYYGLQPDQLQSHHRWMREHCFDHVNIPPAEHPHSRRHGAARRRSKPTAASTRPRSSGPAASTCCCWASAATGTSASTSRSPASSGRTRLCTLDPVTRRALASDFFGEGNVPHAGHHDGPGHDLRRPQDPAAGPRRAQGRDHPRGGRRAGVAARARVVFAGACRRRRCCVDAAAGSQLTSSQTPWALGNVEWTDALIKRAILWLCEQTGKALLKLTDDDFRNHNLHQLLRHHGPAQKVAHQVFQRLMGTIEYHPAGKEPKRVICFSPHPDDDVISMGGTLIRLVEDGHEVHIAYMTSGNIAVFDHDAARVADLVTEYNRLFGIDQERSKLRRRRRCSNRSPRKHAGEPDIEAVQKIKGLIRWSEAKAGAIKVGCREEHLHFLDLPFYRTGTIAKNPIGDDDVRIIRELLERGRSAAGLRRRRPLRSARHAPRLCRGDLPGAAGASKPSAAAGPKCCSIAGPGRNTSCTRSKSPCRSRPGDLLKKRKAIFMHQSQKDEALFPGSDPREFWQRAEDRNTGTAAAYNQVGLPEYYAMEAFVRWNGAGI